MGKGVEWMVGGMERRRDKVLKRETTHGEEREKHCFFIAII